jgi:AcrR family transcriptional regulator
MLQHIDSGQSSAPREETALRRRQRVIEVTISELRQKPFHRVSLESVADAAHLRRGEVTIHFPTWDALIQATIDAWNDIRVAPLTPIGARSGAINLLRAIAISNASDPSLVRVFVAMVNIAASPDHPLSRWLNTKLTDFYDLIEATLAHDIEVGREPSTMEPFRGAEQLIALYEGLQIQSLLRPDMDLVEAYDRAVTRLRRGWADEYQPPTWDTSS